MVDFTDRAEARRWLRTQPREVSVAIAARAALRVLPLLHRARQHRARQTRPADFRSAIVLACFRALAVSWAATKYPAHGTEVRAASAAATNAAATFATNAAANAAADAAAAANAPAAAAATFAAANAAYAANADAANAHAYAINAAATANADAGTVAAFDASGVAFDASAAAFAADADAAMIEIGNNPDQRRLLAAELAGRPLWVGEAPPWASAAWSRLRTRLLAANEDWEVWTEWYEDRLVGHASANPAIDFAYVLPPDALWNDGPKVVNAEIKRLIAAAREKRRLPEGAVSVPAGATAAVLAGEGGLSVGSANAPAGIMALTGEASLIAAAGEVRRFPEEAFRSAPLPLRLSRRPPPEEETLPKQIAGAAIFLRHSSGLIDIAPPDPKDRLVNTDDVRDFYFEVRGKIADVADVGANMLGARLSKAVLKFQARTPENFADAIERRVWSSGNTLRSILAAHDKVADDPDPHPDKLDQGVTERLRDVVDTFNQLAVADPALRQRDASRPGPQEHERSVRELEIASKITAEAARDRSITTPEAGDELLEQIAAATDAGTGLPGRLAIETAGNTQRNFLAGTMIAAYRAIRALPATARGEGGFISREIFGGAYKTAGATLFAATGSAALAVYYVHWEIIHFILTNSDLLKGYAALAFEHSPGFRQMIDWLELHLRPEK